MSNLIDRLFACENPNYAPNGQLIFYILELEKIAQFFKQ
jgi:DNA mismatch repair protein MutL